MLFSFYDSLRFLDDDDSDTSRALLRIPSPTMSEGSMDDEELDRWLDSGDRSPGKFVDSLRFLFISLLLISLFRNC